MSGAVIPAAAIEAAAKSLLAANTHNFPWEDVWPEAQAEYLETARNALEAAAPYMQGEMERELLDAQRVIALLVSDAGGKVTLGRKSITELPRDTVIETTQDVINGGWVIRTRAPK